MTTDNENELSNSNNNSNSSLSSENNNNVIVVQQRWTCEACGCHTNTETENANSCGVCGTHRGLIRREAIALAVSSNNSRGNSFLFNRSNSGSSNRHQNSNYEQTGNNNISGIGNPGFEDEGHDEELAAQLCGVTEDDSSSDRFEYDTLFDGERRRLLRGNNLRSGRSSGGSNTGRRPLNLPNVDELRRTALENAGHYKPVWSSIHKGSSIITPTPNIASLLETCSDEGRCIRVSDALPKKKVIGWKVLFEHTMKEKGRNMGGCYLVGVTTASFSAFGDRSGLQSSRSFWGIEDGGRKYEGGTNATHKESAIPKNIDNVFYGSMEVLSVVFDYESRTLSYWRDDVLLGTLVYHLPKGSCNLYPVAVPFNAGVNVVICALDADPNQILKEWSDNRALVEKERIKNKRQELLEKRKLLYNNNGLTEAFKSTVKRFVSWYAGVDKTDVDCTEISSVMSYRLWYRCGFLYQHLELDDGVYTTGKLLAFLEKIVASEEDAETVEPGVFEVGDKVEVIEGYERYGDASSGPLRVGDRGTVMELQQRGGKQQSVRVEFCGRRWWYQPQALISERSGLIENSIVRCLKKILRVHGYDENLNCFIGDPVREGKWNIGDLVIYLPNKEVGRIVLDNSGNVKREGFVWVDLASVKVGPKRCKVGDLMFTSFFHGLDILPISTSGVGENTPSFKMKTIVKMRKQEEASLNTSKSHTLAHHIHHISNLDKMSITHVIRECKSTSSSLPALFSAGLPSAILSGIDKALNNGNDGISPSTLSTLCNLILNVVKQLFHPEEDNEEEAVSDNQNMNANVRDFIRNLEATNHVHDSSNSSAAAAAAAARRSVFLALVSGNNDKERGNATNPMVEALEDPQRGMLFLNSFNNTRMENNFGYNRSEDNQPVESTGKSTSLIYNILRGHATSGKKYLSSSTKSLIMDGLLGNNIQFVHKTLSSSSSSSVDIKMKDGNDYSLLKLAISFGCDTPLIQALLTSGVSSNSILTENILSLAAYTGQASNVELLLQHCHTTSPNLDLKKCSPEIQKIIKLQKERQITQHEEMMREKEDFLSKLLLKFLKLCWKFKANKTHLSILMDVLVGGTTTLFFQKNISLLDCIPSHILEKAFLNGIELLSLYLQIMESYIWQKNLKDACIGLTLVSTLLRNVGSSSFVYDEFIRYGVYDLTLLHYTFAEQALAEIPQCESVVKCPQGHNTTLHMTKHSSFRCDLCGKGVDQNKPMHGCRECDWDACESCTDKREGGVAKWKYIQKVCQGIQASWKKLDEEVMDEEEEEEEEEELIHLCSKISKRNVLALEELKGWIGIDGKVTMWEFKTCVLPCLNHAIFGSNESLESDLLNPKTKVVLPRRKTKKPKISIRKKESTSEAYVNKKAFLKAAVDILLEKDQIMLASEVQQDQDGLDDDDDDEEDDDEMLEDEDDEMIEDSMDMDSKKRVTCSTVVAVKKNQRYVTQYLHTILAFYERVKLSKQIMSSQLDQKKYHLIASNSSNTNDLQSLLLPFEIELHKSKGECEENYTDLKGAKVFMEPILSFLELHKHIIRCCHMKSPRYVHYCRELARNDAVIAESELRCSTSKKSLKRKIALVVSYHEDTGAHLIRYASSLSGATSNNNLVDVNTIKIDQLEFEGREVLVILAMRDYCILKRDHKYENEVMDYQYQTTYAGNNQQLRKALPPGVRVETTNMGVFSVLSSSIIPAGSSKTNVNRNFYGENDAECNTVILSPDACVSSVNASSTSNVAIPSNSACSIQYNLVSDTGEVLLNIPERSIKGHSSLLLNYHLDSVNQYNTMDQISVIRASNNGLDTRGSSGTTLQQLSRSSFENNNSTSTSKNSQFHVGVMRRTWSALSSLQNMHPLHLSYASTNENEKKSSASLWVASSSTGQRYVEVSMDILTGEQPPRFDVQLTVEDSAPSKVAVNSRDCTTSSTTLFHGLQRLFSELRVQNKKRKHVSLDRKCKLFYSVKIAYPNDLSDDEYINVRSHQTPRSSSLVQMVDEDVNNSNLSWNSNTSKITSLMTDYNTMPQGVLNKDNLPFSNDTKKALVISEGLDETCIHCLELLSAMSSQTFSSTASNTKRQISGKSHLRSSSVDAYPSIFVSDALTNKLMEQLEDPLIVVGGALPNWCILTPIAAPAVFSHASRRRLLERAAFGISRATFCQQEAKVAVGPLRQRMAALRGRAVELVGEAFSGGAADPTALQLQADELYGMEEALAARVTAAFRAQKWDERMLQCVKATVRRDSLLHDASIVMEHYATDTRVNRRRLEISFEGESGFDAASGDEAGVTRGFYADLAEDLLKVEQAGKKLPLWIEDVDASGRAILPSPRVDSHSIPGVYPRPLHSMHPLWNDVHRQFRFMGRAFAAAIRDGFRFPLPLSASFLKLVQSCSSYREKTQHDKKISSFVYGASSSNETAKIDKAYMIYSTVLTSSDLPRPGFLGGEIYALEDFICKPLEEMKTKIYSEDQKTLMKLKLSRDVRFARNALNKNYDCSFEQYFEHRVFVDPFDVSQDSSSYPLCTNGADRPVTIHNVQEYVSLCKNFILKDGVLSQALAFRQGVNDFFSADALKLFTAQELQRDVCGCGDNVENWDEQSIRALFKLDGGKGAAEALIAVAAIGGEGGAALSRRFGPSSPTIAFLVKSLIEASVVERRQFLAFVTSVPIITPGPIEVVPIVNPAGEFLPMSDPSCLPRANTCARRLYLPKFENYQIFHKVFWSIVREESRFKGFYEWRG